ncbi:DUF4192 domain-containing protein [Pseudonocardia humida]|uniref:DUF4192 domain-containing protein n=1 Tax=Pseudonocardia humida TaxID=2800819 RepID=A0ABT1A5T0_9PSEU|nr:DUF4192 domain-containing protein [Pseudonocardia humida]MCO1658375.1 DUF4192 domain-containing protein [Pseudonocardia humida]
MTSTTWPPTGSHVHRPSAARPGPTAPPPHRPPLDGRDPMEPAPDGRRADPTREPTARPPVDEFVIGDPAGLAAAVPALLGFHPRDSLVLLSISGSGAGRRIGLTLRADLPPRSSPPGDLAELGRAVVGMLLRDSPRTAAVLVLAPGRGADLPHRRLVDAMTEALRAHGIGLLSAVWAASTAEGAPWACYLPCGCSGALPDPGTTALAARAVLDGRVVHGSRDDVERTLEPVDPAAIRRRELILTGEDRSTGVLDAPPDDPRELMALVDAAIADAGDGALALDDARAVELAAALATVSVRDGALQRCLGPAAGAAEQLWAALVREVPDPEAAEPAVLLAACALLRGDGALATMALGRAERAWPGHRLTGLLRVLAHAAAPPPEVREVLTASVAEVPGPPRSVRRAGGGSARSSTRRRPSC